MPQSPGRIRWLVVGRPVPDDPRLPIPVPREHFRVGRADGHDIVHAPSPVALPPLEQGAPGTRQPREAGALGGEVTRVVDGRSTLGAAQSDGHRQRHQPFRLPHVDGVAVTTADDRRGRDGVRDGIRPDMGEAEVPGGLRGAAEGRRRESAGACDQAGCHGWRVVVRGWQSRAGQPRERLWLGHPQDPEPIHGLIRRQVGARACHDRDAVAGLGQGVGHLPHPGVVLERVVDDERGRAHRAGPRASWLTSAACGSRRAAGTARSGRQRCAPSCSAPARRSGNAPGGPAGPPPAGPGWTPGRRRWRAGNRCPRRRRPLPTMSAGTGRCPRRPPRARPP